LRVSTGCVMTPKVFVLASWLFVQFRWKQYKAPERHSSPKFCLCCHSPRVFACVDCLLVGRSFLFFQGDYSAKQPPPQKLADAGTLVYRPARVAVPLTSLLRLPYLSFVTLSFWRRGTPKDLQVWAPPARVPTLTDLRLCR